MSIFSILFGGGNKKKRITFDKNCRYVQLYALQDDESCDICKALDLKVFKPEHPICQFEQLHPGCRCMWVEILKDEVDPPRLSRITPKLQAIIDKVCNQKF